VLSLSRRSHARYLVNKIVSYRHEGESLLTLTLDLSLGGMKIKTHAPLPEHECLKFRLVLGAHSIWPRGRIAYSRFTPGRQMVSGVEFIELSETDRCSLRNYLETLEEDDYGLPFSRGGAFLASENR
jgi:c-di-GMP-binding flagellar brake protein YcgR